MPFIFSMTVFGTIGIFVRGISLPSAEIAFFRAILAIAVIGAVMLLAKKKINLRAMGKRAILLFISGVAMGFNWIFLFEAYKYTSVSAATLSYYFAPILVTLLSPIVFRERFTVKGIVSFVGATVGIVLITGIGDFSLGDTHLLGIGLGLIAATLYATVIILNKFLGDITGMERTLLQFISAAAVLLPYLICSGGFSITGIDPKGAFLLITVGILHTGVTYLIYFSSIAAIPGQEAAILSYIDPLVALICSVAVLQEPLTPTLVIGAVLVLGFTMLSEISFQKKPKSN